MDEKWPIDPTAQEWETIVATDAERRRARQAPYDPITGEGACGERVRCGEVWLPAQLVEAVPQFATLDETSQRLVRIRYDFEYWCAIAVVIKDKLTGRNVPFRLNRPQRRLLATMEAMRVARRPIRVILLKARQWGGSTLVQIYMAWFQLVLHEGWNSLICGHLRTTARAIKHIYKRLLTHYPTDLVDEGTKPAFTNFEGSNTVQQLTPGGSLVIMGTARSEDAVRGYDIAMAHLSEVAFWQHTTMHDPDDVIRSVCGAIALEPDTIIVLESTANGVGSMFHNEWLRARAGLSDKEPVFVPWHEIEIYRREVDDARQLWREMDEYERELWRSGCTLDEINWYHHKRREYSSHSMMMAEYPSNDIEAFVNSGHCVFDLTQLDRLRTTCLIPAAVGDIEADFQTTRNVHFVPMHKGPLQVWAQPVAGAMGRYLATVDVGGRSDKADWSVIAVWDLHDRRTERPEIVAQWRGHIDHDLLAWKAAQLARYYSNALLVIESNTLETEQTEADSGNYILDVLARAYPHLYRRMGRHRQRLPGFQTNRKTKREAIYRLVAAVRDGTYVERDAAAVDEMSCYQLDAAGRFGAMPGKHDDILMTRAIGLWVIQEIAPLRPAPTAEEKDALMGLVSGGRVKT